VKILEVKKQFYFSRTTSTVSHVGKYRLLELREQIKVFLEERDCDKPEELESQEFNLILAYLSDIFTCTNNLSLLL